MHKISFTVNLKTLNFQELQSNLQSNTKIVITTHKSPDGDAIGSSMGLAHCLTSIGCTVNVVVPDAYPGFLSWMDRNQSIIVDQWKPGLASDVIQNAEVIFSLDYNNLSRVGDLGEKIAASNASKVLIDHHLDPDLNFDFVLSDTSASSTAQLVYSFLVEMRLDQYIDTHVAECLYAGIMTDTGSFRFPSTTAYTHRAVADLMDKGLKPSIVHEKVFDSNSFSRLKLLGHILGENLKLHKSERAVTMSLSIEEKARFEFRKGDTEGFVNYGLSISNVELSIFLTEDDGYVKLSLRSKGELDVNSIARKNFQGGGHKNAAGGKIDGDLEYAVELVNQVLDETIN